MKTLFSVFDSQKLLTAVSSKEYGSLRLCEDEEENIQVQKRRERFFQSQGISQSSLVYANLVHGNTIAIVTNSNKGQIIPATDGLITQEKGLFLCLTVADCLPVFLYDPEQKVVGLLHAGWRGLEKSIVANALSIFIKRFGSKPQAIRVAIGPGISACHFQVQKDVFKKFNAFDDALSTKNGSFFLDLKRIAFLQAELSGVRSDHIFTSPACTYCMKDTYFSYRRDTPSMLKAMLSCIGMPLAQR